jgi:hypothetical protein
VPYSPLYPQWHDFPVTDTPITAAALQGIDDALVSTTSVVVYPEDYGAVGNGTTDDTAALVAALAAAAGGTLQLRSKTYVVKKTTTYQSALQPAANTQISGLGGSTLKIDPASATGTIIAHIAANDVSFDGVTFDQGNITDSVGLQIGASLRASISDCSFTNPTAAAINLTNGSYDVLITRNSFLGAGYGVLTNSPAAAGRWLISNNTFYGGATGDAIELNNPSGVLTDVTIVGNVISGYSNTVTSGIGIGAANVQRLTIVGNTITTMGLDGIHLEDGVSSFTVSGNTIHACARAGVSLQSSAGRTSGRGSIGDNTVSSCGTGSGTGGIALEGSFAVKDVAVAGNSVRDCGRAGAANFYGIDTGYQSDGIMVTGNVVRDTAGTVCAGIVVNASVNMSVVGNLCTGQQYGIRTAGASLSDVIVALNSLQENSTAAMLDGGSGTRYWKLLNTGVAPTSVTGSRGANAALASLLTGLAGMGLVTDGTS